MTTIESDFTQRQAAKLTGYSLLLLIVSGIAGNFFVGSGIIAEDNAAKTAYNLVAFQTRFRVSIICTLIMFNCDIVEAVALYALLKPVHKSLALLSTFWRLANACIGGALAFTDFFAIHTAQRSQDLAGFSSVQAGSLMSLFLDNANEVSLIGLLSFSFGMAINGYLFIKSRFIPSILAVLYYFASMVLMTGTLVLLVYPSSAHLIKPGFVIPDFIAELSLALWLIFKGISR